ncbi:hypothetical protein L1987_59634 [Smallanthus sonchifolius]|uniref:Uncharacterized protein n=1 Tax=Smallanthus sonchifolius TaxID=185202 RepID=A0ACB9D619_9ASTR|nr:hypothetical protein L1987_59634 [Smallanthus sonchifolius]
MRTQRVLDEDSQYTFKVHRFFSVKGLHDMENWKYTLTERKHILKDRKTGRVLFGVREDVLSLVEDFMEEEDDTEESESESEDETETEKATRRLKKSIHEHVVANWPAEYEGWDRPFQMLWNQNARNNKIHNRRMTKLEENQERHALVPTPPLEPGGSGSSDGTLQDVEDMFKDYFGEQVKSQPYDHHYYLSDYQPPGSGTH